MTEAYIKEDAYLKRGSSGDIRISLVNSKFNAISASIVFILQFVTIPPAMDSCL